MTCIVGIEMIKGALSITTNARKIADHSQLSNVLQSRSVIGKNNPVLPTTFQSKQQTSPIIHKTSSSLVSKKDLMQRATHR